MDPSVLSHDLIPTMVKKSKNIKNRLTSFQFLVSQTPDTQAFNDFPSSQGLQGTIAMPAVTIHAPPDRHRHLGDGSAPSSAGLAGRAGRSGYAAVWKCVMGYAGLRPPAMFPLEIAMNLICQSNQKENRRSK
jgi:hypothetical protein